MADRLAGEITRQNRSAPQSLFRVIVFSLEKPVKHNVQLDVKQYIMFAGGCKASIMRPSHPKTSLTASNG